MSVFSLFGSVLVLAGCARPPAQVAPTAPPTVIFEVPITRSVTEFEEFTGHTEAFEFVELKANVPGYLSKIHVPEGTSVSKGELLFTIDPRVYQAQESSARATVEKSRADLKLAEASFVRAKDAWKRQVIGQEDYDKAEAARDAAKASLDSAIASHELAKTNLEYTTIRAEYTGRLGRKEVSVGAMVKERDTLLNTLAVLDPIYVTFDIDERTLLRLRRLIREGKISPSRGTNRLKIQVGLADEDTYSFTATMTFFSNVLDANTGTLRVKAEMDNPDLQIDALPALAGAAGAVEYEQRGLKLLSPSMFVRIRLPVGTAHPALLIPEEALGSDQGERFVYVINDKDEVVYRRVAPGIQDGRYRVIETGLKPGERVIVSGHQRVRPGIKVTPKKAEAAPSTSAASPSTGTPK